MSAIKNSRERLLASSSRKVKQGHDLKESALGKAVELSVEAGKHDSRSHTRKPRELMSLNTSHRTQWRSRRASKGIIFSCISLGPRLHLRSRVESSRVSNPKSLVNLVGMPVSSLQSCLGDLSPPSPVTAQRSTGRSVLFSRWPLHGFVQRTQKTH